jgi:hypothetical protein
MEPLMELRRDRREQLDFFRHWRIWSNLRCCYFVVGLVWPSDCMFFRNSEYPGFGLRGSRSRVSNF